MMCACISLQNDQYIVLVVRFFFSSSKLLLIVTICFRFRLVWGTRRFSHIYRHTYLWLFLGRRWKVYCIHCYMIQTKRNWKKPVFFSFRQYLLQWSVYFEWLKFFFLLSLDYFYFVPMWFLKFICASFSWNLTLDTNVFLFFSSLFLFNHK